MPSGRIFSSELITSLTEQWLDLVRRDRGHPSVIGWVPFNESWGWHIQQRPEQRAFVDGLVALTKALDPSRPVIGNDGWEYTSGDLWTLHLYHDAERSLDQRLTALAADPSQPVTQGERPRNGALPGTDPSHLPMLLTECGGVGFESDTQHDNAFAYGDLPTDVEALEQEIRQIMASINASENAPGLCLDPTDRCAARGKWIVVLRSQAKAAPRHTQRNFCRPNTTVSRVNQAVCKLIKANRANQA